MPTVYQMPTMNCKSVDRSEYVNLLENDLNSDVNFVVQVRDGRKNNDIRIPAHTDILLQANNEVINQMLTVEPTQKTFYLNGNPRGFKNLLRLIYHQPVQISSMSTALESLQTAIKFKCPQLADLCARKVDFFLASHNVLDVLKIIGFSNTQSPIINNSEITLTLNNLRRNCYILIDMDPKPILNNEEMEELTRDQIELILSRNTLQKINEKDIWDCLNQWVTCECQRLSCENSNSMKRKILGNTGKMVRYSLMTKKDYLAGPGRIFMDYENDEIFRQMKNNERLRRIGEVETMIPLSDRSSAKTKKKTRKSRADDEEYDSCLFCCLKGFICIFD